MSHPYERQAKFFRALMHPARLALLDVLRDGEACVCHLETALGYRQAYISQQLGVLREAGMVADRREGWNMYYRVVMPQVFELMDMVRMAVHDDDLRRSAPRRLADCPCPKCHSTETALRESDHGYRHIH